MAFTSKQKLSASSRVLELKSTKEKETSSNSLWEPNQRAYYDSLQIQLASPQQMFSWHHQITDGLMSVSQLSRGEVVEPSTYDYKNFKPTKWGLFCDVIFGALKNKKDRRRRFGYIRLASPIMHVWFFKNAISSVSVLTNRKPKHLKKLIYSGGFTPHYPHAFETYQDHFKSNKSLLSLFKSGQPLFPKTMGLKRGFNGKQIHGSTLSPFKGVDREDLQHHISRLIPKQTHVSVLWYKWLQEKSVWITESKHLEFRLKKATKPDYTESWVTKATTRVMATQETTPYVYRQLSPFVFERRFHLKKQALKKLAFKKQAFRKRVLLKSQIKTFLSREETQAVDEFINFFDLHKSLTDKRWIREFNFSKHVSARQMALSMLSALAKRRASYRVHKKNINDHWYKLEIKRLHEEEKLRENLMKSGETHPAPEELEERVNRIRNKEIWEASKGPTKLSWPKEIKRKATYRELYDCALALDPRLESGPGACWDPVTGFVHNRRVGVWSTVLHNIEEHNEDLYHELKGYLSKVRRLGLQPEMPQKLKKSLKLLNLIGPFPSDFSFEMWPRVPRHVANRYDRVHHEIDLYREEYWAKYWAELELRAESEEDEEEPGPIGESEIKAFIFGKGSEKIPFYRASKAVRNVIKVMASSKFNPSLRPLMFRNEAMLKHCNFLQLYMTRDNLCPKIYAFKNVYKPKHLNHVLKTAPNLVPFVNLKRNTVPYEVLLGQTTQNISEKNTNTNANEERNSLTFLSNIVAHSSPKPGEGFRRLKRNDKGWAYGYDCGVPHIAWNRFSLSKLWHSKTPLLQDHTKSCANPNENKTWRLRFYRSPYLEDLKQSVVSLKFPHAYHYGLYHQCVYGFDYNTIHQKKHRVKVKKRAKHSYELKLGKWQALYFQADPFLNQALGYDALAKKSKHTHLKKPFGFNRALFQLDGGYQTVFNDDVVVFIDFIKPNRDDPGETRINHVISQRKRISHVLNDFYEPKKKTRKERQGLFNELSLNVTLVINAWRKQEKLKQTLSIGYQHMKAKPNLNPFELKRIKRLMGQWLKLYWNNQMKQIQGLPETKFKPVYQPSCSCHDDTEINLSHDKHRIDFDFHTTGLSFEAQRVNTQKYVQDKPCHVPKFSFQSGLNDQKTLEDLGNIYLPLYEKRWRVMHDSFSFYCCNAFTQRNFKIPHTLLLQPYLDCTLNTRLYWFSIYLCSKVGNVLTIVSDPKTCLQRKVQPYALLSFLSKGFDRPPFVQTESGYLATTTGKREQQNQQENERRQALYKQNPDKYPIPDQEEPPGFNPDFDKLIVRDVGAPMTYTKSYFYTGIDQPKQKVKTSAKHYAFRSKFDLRKTPYPRNPLAHHYYANLVRIQFQSSLKKARSVALLSSFNDFLGFENRHDEKDNLLFWFQTYVTKNGQSGVSVSKQTLVNFLKLKQKHALNDHCVNWDKALFYYPKPDETALSFVFLPDQPHVFYDKLTPTKSRLNNLRLRRKQSNKTLALKCHIYDFFYANVFQKKFNTKPNANSLTQPNLNSLSLRFDPWQPTWYRVYKIYHLADFEIMFSKLVMKIVQLLSLAEERRLLKRRKIIYTSKLSARMKAKEVILLTNATILTPIQKDFEIDGSLERVGLDDKVRRSIMKMLDEKPVKTRRVKIRIAKKLKRVLALQVIKDIPWRFGYHHQIPKNNLKTFPPKKLLTYYCRTQLKQWPHLQKKLHRPWPRFIYFNDSKTDVITWLDYFQTNLFSEANPKKPCALGWKIPKWRHLYQPNYDSHKHNLKTHHDKLQSGLPHHLKLNTAYISHSHSITPPLFVFQTEAAYVTFQSFFSPLALMQDRLNVNYLERSLTFPTSTTSTSVIKLQLDHYGRYAADFQHFTRCIRQHIDFIGKIIDHDRGLRKRWDPVEPFDFDEPKERDGVRRDASVSALLKVKNLSRNTEPKLVDTIIRMTILKHRYIRRLKKQQRALIRQLKFSSPYVNSPVNPSWMALTILPVCPPDLRPMVALDDQQVAVSDLNKFYQEILFRNRRQMRAYKQRSGSISETFTLNTHALRPGYDYYYNRVNNTPYLRFLQRAMQESVDNLMENGKAGAKPLTAANDRPLKSLSDSLKGKKGRFRQNLLGKRVDYSGRSVIVVGPELKLHQCGLPEEMALVLFQNHLLRVLLDLHKEDSIASVKKMIQEKRPHVLRILEKIMESRPVLLNRAPTLHRLGIQAFQSKLVSGRAILLHPLVCSAFNADFDGDQMAVHIPLSPKSSAEAWALMWSLNHLRSIATGDAQLLPSQDMVLGCYYLTSWDSLTRWKQLKQHCVSFDPTFNDLKQVEQSYVLQKRSLHSVIWLKAQPPFEFLHSQPCFELQIHCSGLTTYLYPDYKQHQSNQSNQSQCVFIKTTVGRTLAHQSLSSTLNKTLQGA